MKEYADVKDKCDELIDITQCLEIIFTNKELAMYPRQPYVTLFQLLEKGLKEIYDHAGEQMCEGEGFKAFRFKTLDKEELKELRDE